MTAVRLRTLRREIASLLARPESVPERAAALNALLAQYANHAYRPGAQADADEPAYHTAPVVLPEVWRGLRHGLPARPDDRLALADALWAHRVREPRLLAARVLSQMSPTEHEAVFERVWTWLAVRDRRVRDAVLAHAVRPLTRAGDALLDHLTLHLPPQGEIDEAARALALVTRLVMDSDFDNTPALFRALRAGLRHPTDALRPEWVPVLRAVVHRWPAEAVPFLRRALWETRDQAGVLWLLRRVLPATPPAWRDRVAGLLREAAPPTA